MIRVSLKDFGEEVSRYENTAMNEPVVVTLDGRDRTVMISAEEYHRLKRRERQVFPAGTLPNDVLEAVGRATMDSRHNHLNDLLEDGVQ